MGIDNPAARERDETYVSMIWQTYYIIQTEPLKSWRNGVAVVVDLKGAGLNNIGIQGSTIYIHIYLFSLIEVDVSAKGRELNAALQGIFPFRIRAISSPLPPLTSPLSHSLLFFFF